MQNGFFGSSLTDAMNDQSMTWNLFLVSLTISYVNTYILYKKRTVLTSAAHIPLFELPFPCMQPRAAVVLRGGSSSLLNPATRIFDYEPASPVFTSKLLIVSFFKTLPKILFRPWKSTKKCLNWYCKFLAKFFKT